MLEWMLEWLQSAVNVEFGIGIIVGVLLSGGIVAYSVIGDDNIIILIVVIIIEVAVIVLLPIYTLIPLNSIFLGYIVAAVICWVGGAIKQLVEELVEKIKETREKKNILFFDVDKDTK
ncbi:hypothetical protein AGMMS4956_02610 [Bacteroidia bacterium]|nr:hypothetical protein AGMMS4956_02610 [Bacteroidia bacterium]